MPRSGVLSDASIIANCYTHRPIPMSIANNFLGETPQRVPLGGRKLKYPIQQNRPQTLNAILSKHDETVRDNLEKRYTDLLAKPPNQEIQLPQRATSVSMSSNSNPSVFTPNNTASSSTSEEPPYRIRKPKQTKEEKKEYDAERYRKKVVASVLDDVISQVENKAQEEEPEEEPEEEM